MTLPLEPGTVIGGKYCIVRLIAEGGMGAVALARHQELGKDVAIKFVLPELAQRRDAAERFRREARAAASLASDHVARVWDVDRLEDGAPYLVMEYLEGEDLDALIERVGPLPVGRAAAYLIEALDALVEAHDSGIIHRDLKPSNLFLAQRPVGQPRIKVLDFGISKLIKDNLQADAAATSTGAVFGSPGYMSPEQIRSARDVDERTDIWALGVIFYELLAGKVLFSGETVGAVLAQVLSDPIAPITTVRNDLPEEIVRIIERCLERERSKRFRSARELMEALAPFADGAEAARPSRDASLVSAPTMLVDSARPEHTEPTLPAVAPAPGAVTDMSWSERSGGADRRRHALAFGAVVLVGGAALFAWFGLRSTDDGSAEERPAATTTSESELAPSVSAAVPRVASSPEPSSSPPVTSALDTASSASAAASASAPPELPRQVLPRPAGLPKPNAGVDLDQRH